MIYLELSTFLQQNNRCFSRRHNQPAPAKPNGAAWLRPKCRGFQCGGHCKMAVYFYSCSNFHKPTMKKGLFMPVPIPIPHALPRLAACATVAACPHGTAGLTARRIQGESRAPSAPAGSRLLRAHLQFLVARRGGVRKATCRFSFCARSVNPFVATAPVFDSTSGGLCKPRIQGVNHD